MRITSEQLRAFAESPAKFRDSLIVDTDNGPRPFSAVMDDWQRKDFESLDPGWMRAAGIGNGGPSRHWIERPRGHSKSADLASLVLWILAFAPKQVQGVSAAADKSQARLMRNAIAKLVRMNAWLSDVIDIQHSRIVNRRTHSELEILSSDAPSSFGRLPDFVTADEVSHWGSRELWDSLISSSAKRGNCVFTAILNSGWSQSWQWDVREAVRQDPNWYFSRLDGPKASWIRPELLDEQRRLLPAPAFERLWMNRWSSGSGDALDASDIERACKEIGPMLQWERGWSFVAGLDLGISQDHSALAIVGRHIGFSETKVSEPKQRSPLNNVLTDLGYIAPAAPEESDDYIHHTGTHRLRLANLQSWKPPKKGKIDLQQIENAVLHAHDTYGLAGCFFDPYQCSHMAQRLSRRGVRMIEVSFSASNLQQMASALLESFASEHISMYTHRELMLQLSQLRVVERSYGYRLESPRTKDGHGDLAVGFILALFGAKKLRITPSLTRPLLHEGLTDNFEDDRHDELFHNSPLNIEW